MSPVLQWPLGRLVRNVLAGGTAAALALAPLPEGAARAEALTPITVADVPPESDFEVFDDASEDDSAAVGLDMLSDVFGGVGSVGVAFFALYLVAAFVLIYFAGDRQSRADGRRDPALGARVLVGFLLTLAGQVGVVALTGLLAVLVEAGGGLAIRTTLGLTVGACLSAIVPLVIARRIPALAAGAPDVVTRKVWGVNAFIAGLTSAASLVSTTTVLFASQRLESTLVVVLVVYAVAAVVTGLQVTRPRRADG